MLRSLHTAALGMKAQQTNVDNTANNLANANTTGFKESRVVFQDLLYETMETVDESQESGETDQPSTLQIGHGSTAVATVRNFTTGGLQETGNQLDVAISGDGFLQVARPDGSIAYTRDGNLTTDGQGRVMTQSGLPLQPNISVPQDTTRLEISSDGVVTAYMQGDSGGVELGQLELTRFSNPGGLEAIGGNLYEATESSGRPLFGVPGTDGLGTIRQGFLEQSNVDVVQEMVNLISAQRSYEINSKMVTTSEEMLQTANNMKR